MSDAENRLPKSRAALAQLEHALTRLDRAVKGRKSEQTLQTELAAARADYERLAVTARTVEARLDGVGGRLRAVLQN